MAKASNISSKVDDSAGVATAQPAAALSSFAGRWCSRCAFCAAVALSFMFGAVFELRQQRQVAFNAQSSNVEVLSWAPRIFLKRGFLSADEARYVVSLAMNETELKASGTSSGASGATRTSSTAWMFAHQDDDPLLSEIVDRMHTLARIPRSHGEVLSVARYKRGEQYGWHHDSDDKEVRLATVLVYVGSPSKGGETIFPFAVGRRHRPASPPPFDKAIGKGPTAETLFEPYCVRDAGGVKIAPRVGDALLFYSHYTNLKLDQDAWHASCPVLDGTKWIMQRWMKAVPMAAYIKQNYNMSYSEWKQLAARVDKKRRKAKRTAGIHQSAQQTRKRSHDSEGSDL